jgi:catechol 2,3-dioxygenase-like lactoylglutathione lyase family enzyme
MRGEHMGLSYMSIRVKNMKKSLDFYKKMGLKVVGRRSPIPHEEIVMLEDKKTHQRLNLMWYGKKCKWYTPYKMNGVELDHLMFEVKDAKKEYQKLLKKGAPKATDLWEGKERMMGLVKDPNGIWVGVMSQVKAKK